MARYVCNRGGIPPEKGKRNMPLAFLRGGHVFHFSVGKSLSVDWCADREALHLSVLKYGAFFQSTFLPPLQEIEAIGAVAVILIGKEDGFPSALLVKVRLL